MVRVVGPDGNPFWAHLATDYERQILAQTEQAIPTPEEQDQMVEQWLRDEGIDPATASEEDRKLAESAVEDEISQSILAFQADQDKAPFPRLDGPRLLHRPGSTPLRQGKGRQRRWRSPRSIRSRHESVVFDAARVDCRV